MAEQDVRTTLDRAGLLQALVFPLEVVTEFEPSLVTIGVLGEATSRSVKARTTGGWRDRRPSLEPKFMPRPCRGRLVEEFEFLEGRGGM